MRTRMYGGVRGRGLGAPSYSIFYHARWKMTFYRLLSCLTPSSLVLIPSERDSGHTNCNRCQRSEPRSIPFPAQTIGLGLDKEGPDGKRTDTLLKVVNPVQLYYDLL